MSGIHLISDEFIYTDLWVCCMNIFMHPIEHKQSVRRVTGPVFFLFCSQTIEKNKKIVYTNYITCLLIRN